MPTRPDQQPPGPVRTAERITSLDTIRGIAILGILPMNALAFGLDRAAYLNVSADGIGQPLDWIVGIVTMAFVDQKMMALFSLLFGVGVVVFADRARDKGRRVVWLSLWRFALLFAIGVAHTVVWEGDILALYGVCAPVVLLVRGMRPRILAVAGTMLALVGAVTAPFVQASVADDVSELGDLWFAEGGAMSEVVEGWFVLNAAGRALGLMLIGVALYRSGIVQGARPAAVYRRLAVWGLGMGTAVTAVGLVIRAASEWSADQALTGHIPTGLGTIPMALGLMALFISFDRIGSRHVERVRNTGRMALTNYLAQTALGLVTLGWLSDQFELTRTAIVAWIVAVWVLQLWWSTAWLSRFRYGPLEWAWRCATYRTVQPLRRSSS